MLPSKSKILEGHGLKKSKDWKYFCVVVPGQEDLGGNLRHGDTNAITPTLWRYLIDRFAIRTLLDVGCGEGHAVEFFRRLGVIAHGFDGLERNVRNARHPIALHDLTKSPYIYPCDMTLCVEMVEHLDKAHLPNLLTTLINAPVVVMTHGLPGQPGHHHVNNRPSAYWIEKLGHCGYLLSEENIAFRKIAIREVPDCYFGRSGLVFLKKSELPPARARRRQAGRAA